MVSPASVPPSATLEARLDPPPASLGAGGTPWWAWAIQFHLTLLPQWLKKTGPSQSTYVLRANRDRQCFVIREERLLFTLSTSKKQLTPRAAGSPFVIKRRAEARKSLHTKTERTGLWWCPWSLVMPLSHWIKMNPQPALHQDFLVTQVISLLLKESKGIFATSKVLTAILIQTTRKMRQRCSQQLAWAIKSGDRIWIQFDSEVHAFPYDPITWDLVPWWVSRSFTGACHLDKGRGLRSASVSGLYDARGFCQSFLIVILKYSSLTNIYFKNEEINECS